MGLENLLSLIHDYSPSDKELIIKAYEFARAAHAGVVRKSGEPYIIHPLCVAIIIAEMQADADTIAASLLHDCIEDVDGVTVSLLKEQFNSTVANLVDGVTKIDKILFNDNKKLANYASHKKLIEYMCKDIRILIIKLADRLHNMRTLIYHNEQKQLEISKETMEYYVPFAELIGAYNLKLDLEDLAFNYLNHDEYKHMVKIERDMVKKNRQDLDEILCSISQMLNSANVPYDVKLQVKNYYGLYKRLKTYKDPESVHDLFQIKYLLNDIGDCYRLRENIKKLYKPLQEKSKDYILNPKTNMYRALHTSVNVKPDLIAQFQICTNNMDLINRYGLTAHWFQKLQENPVELMQHDFTSLQIFQVINEIVTTETDIENFNNQIFSNVLGEKVYVSTPNGEVVELPNGSTPLDYAYYIHTDLGDFYDFAKVNGIIVEPSYKLKNKDMVEIVFEKNKEPNIEELIANAYTAHAKKCIKGIRRRELKRNLSML